MKKAYLFSAWIMLATMTHQLSAAQSGDGQVKINCHSSGQQKLPQLTIPTSPVSNAKTENARHIMRLCIKHYEKGTFDKNHLQWYAPHFDSPQ